MNNNKLSEKETKKMKNKKDIVIELKLDISYWHYAIDKSTSYDVK